MAPISRSKCGRSSRGGTRWVGKVDDAYGMSSSWSLASMARAAFLRLPAGVSSFTKSITSNGRRNRTCLWSKADR